MPSQFFQTKKVTYGMAPFTDAKVAFNASAGCLNLMVKGARCGAIEIVKGLGGPNAPRVVAEGEKCRIGQVVEVDFLEAAEAQRFASCLASADVKVATAAEGTPAPSTPPLAAKGGADMATPPKTKRLRLETTEASSGAEKGRKEA